MTTLNSRLQLALLNRKKGRNLLEKGFTLVELMIVIVIVGVLSAVALPNFLGTNTQSQSDRMQHQGRSTTSEIGAEHLRDQADGAALFTSKTATGSDLNTDAEYCTFTLKLTQPRHQFTY